LKNSTRKSYFNIIEVALAMAVIGLGMTSIMALFPVGINASRSAVGNTAATEVAENFMGYIKSYAETDTTNYNTIEGQLNLIGDTGSATPNDFITQITAVTNMNHVNAETCQFMRDLKDGTIDSVSSDYEAIAGWDNLFKNGKASPNDRKFLYIVIQHKDSSTTDPDFSAAIIIWKAPLNSLQNSGKTGVVWPATGVTSEIFALNAEVSWPLSKLYKDREKRYFQSIIVKP
jgi:hypothetical protein